MACGFYDEAKNGLKMSVVGAAVGALVWFVAGSGAKQSYDKFKREREKEASEERRERERESRKREADERRETRKEARPEPRRGADGGTFADARFSWRESL